MARRISNDTLAGLLVIAIVISVIGTLGSLGGGAPVYITGAATTGTGTASASITADYDFTLTNSTIVYTTGSIVAAQTSATLDTEGTNTNWDAAIDNSNEFEIRNDGNSPINITIKSDKNSTAFICDGSAGEVLGTSCGYTTTPSFKFKPGDTGNSRGEASSCNGETASYTAFTLANTEYEFCPTLYPDGSRDQMVAEFEVVVPDDAEGSKIATITFTSYDSSTA